MSTSPRSSRTTKDLSGYGASYYTGLTIEADPESNPPKLVIDGHRIPVDKVGRNFIYSDGNRSIRTQTLAQLSKRIIHRDYKKREKIRQAHLAELRKGLDSWNK